MDDEITFIVEGREGAGMSCSTIKLVQEEYEKQHKHGLNQCANDWIMCKCGKLFADSRNGKRTAKEKFINHLHENGLTDKAFEYDKKIIKITKCTKGVKTN